MPPYMVLGYTAVVLKHQFKEDTAKCVICNFDKLFDGSYRPLEN